MGGGSTIERARRLGMRRRRRSSRGRGCATGRAPCNINLTAVCCSRGRSRQTFQSGLRAPRVNRSCPVRMPGGERLGAGRNPFVGIEGAEHGSQQRHHWIRKFTLLTSCTDPSRLHVMRTRAAVVAGPVTVHGNVPFVLPLFARSAAITAHVPPRHGSIQRQPSPRCRGCAPT